LWTTAAPPPTNANPWFAALSGRQNLIREQ
jgi:hypothetical protein